VKEGMEREGEEGMEEDRKGRRRMETGEERRGCLSSLLAKIPRAPMTVFLAAYDGIHVT